MSPEQFLALIGQAVRDERPRVAIGTIDEGWGGAGLPSVRFDGEDTAAVRGRPYLSAYTPAAGDRVLLVRAGTGEGWVIVGEIVSA